MISRALATRDGRNGRGFLDVRYDDLVADPIAEIRRIYAFWDVDLTSDGLDAIEAERGRTRQHRYGRHAYAAEDFGLTSAGITDRFAAYSDRFGLA